MAWSVKAEDVKMLLCIPSTMKDVINVVHILNLVVTCLNNRYRYYVNFCYALQKFGSHYSKIANCKISNAQVKNSISH